MTTAQSGYRPPDTASDQTSKTDVAKEQASELGRTTKDAGSQLAGTAGEQARSVADEGRRQAANMTHEVGNQAREQAGVQKDRASQGLHSLSDELRTMADNGEQSGPATALARQGADMVHDFAQWLDGHDPGGLLDEVRSFARRKPGAFLFGAVAAGVVAGRLTRGGVQAARSDDGTGGQASHQGARPATRTTTGTDAPVLTGDQGTAVGARSNAGTAAPLSSEPASATPIGDEAAADTHVIEFDEIGDPAQPTRFEATGRSR